MEKWSKKHHNGCHWCHCLASETDTFLTFQIHRKYWSTSFQFPCDTLSQFYCDGLTVITLVILHCVLLSWCLSSIETFFSQVKIIWDSTLGYMIIQSELQLPKTSTSQIVTWKPFPIVVAPYLFEQLKQLCVHSEHFCLLASRQARVVLTGLKKSFVFYLKFLISMILAPVSVTTVCCQPLPKQYLNIEIETRNNYRQR